jgi:hypothetical protein
MTSPPSSIPIGDLRAGKYADYRIETGALGMPDRIEIKSGGTWVAGPYLISQNPNDVFDPVAGVISAAEG